MPLAWIYFLLYSTIFYSAQLTQPAANLPRAANIVMSQSNTVYSSFPENLACLLMLQYQINFCSLSLVSFSLFSSDLLSGIVSHKRFAAMGMMEKDYSRSARKESKWKSPNLPYAEGSALMLGEGWQGQCPQAATAVPACPSTAPGLLSQQLPAAMAHRAAPGPQGCLTGQLLSSCPCAQAGWTAGTGSWQSLSSCILVQAPHAGVPYSSCQQSREESQTSRFATDIRRTGRAGSAPGASLHTCIYCRKKWNLL